VSAHSYFSNLFWRFGICIARSKRDDYCAETSFRLWVKRNSAFESAGVSAHTAARRQGGSIWQAMTCLSLSNSWVTHSIPLFTLSSPFLAHLCAITFRMSYTSHGAQYKSRCTIRRILSKRLKSMLKRKIRVLIKLCVLSCVVRWWVHGSQWTHQHRLRLDGVTINMAVSTQFSANNFINILYFSIDISLLFKT
jgi:hypothetical protein